MQRTFHSASSVLAGVTALAFLLPSSALAGQKEAAHEEMRSLAHQIEVLKGQGGAAERVAELQRRYDLFSSALGGDQPSALGSGLETPRPTILAAAPAPPGATLTTTNHANTTPTAIVDLSSNTSTIDVVGAGTILWDLDLTTNILHTFASDLDIRLTSPAGTVVVISTDNGSGNDNVFDGSVFDDEEAIPVNDWLYVNLTTAGPMTPEGVLGLFRGEDPNGTWTIDVADDAGGDTGSFTWSFDLTTIDALPAETSTSAANTTPTTIVDLSSNTSTIDIAGAGSFICDVEVTTNILHTFASDLDIRLTSPAGTVVVVSTDNGSGNDNVFDGSLFDDQQAVPVSDWSYTNLVTAGPMTPEGAFGRFAGEDPNGTWTIDVADDAGGDTGSFTWSLTVKTCTAGPTTGTAICFGDGSGAPCGCGNEGPAGGGCLNSVGLGAVLTAAGDASVSADTMTLTADNVINQPGLFFQGDNAVSGGSGQTFGDGIRCCGQNVIRIEVVNPPGTGSPATAQMSETATTNGPAGTITAGSTKCYQYWYRDPSGGGVCGTSFNLSNAISITWGI